MEVIHTLLIVAASSCLLPQQAFCSTYICNGRVTEQSDNSTDLPECTIMGNEPKSWEDASVYCRSFGGALRSSGVDRADIFIENGVSSLWSGIFKRNGTALQETPKTPIQAVWDVDQWDLSQLSEIPGQSECAQFVHKPCDVIRLGRWKRRQTQDQGKDGCKYKFVLEWTNCASKRDFVCEIPARPLLSLHMQANKKFSIDAELGFEMFFTSGKASYQSSSLLCGRGPGSFTFNISTPVDRAVIKFVAQNVKDHIQQLGLSTLDHQTSLFWVDDTDTPGCDALSLQTFGDEGFAFGHIISWSCEARLRVLCKSQVPVRGTEAPLISVNLYGQDQLAMGQDKSILVHSKIPKTAYIGILGRRKGAGLQIGCHVSTPSNGQRVTLYQDNQPILHYDGKKDMSQEIITSLEDEATHLNESSIMIDLAGFYHCEMNDLRTHRVLKSDRIFIQRRDLELYSIQIRFKHYSDQADWNRLQQELLFNDHRGQREAGRRLIYGLKATAQHAGGFSIKPLTLEPRSRTLVAYLYRALPEMKQHPITEVTLNKIRLQEIQLVSNSIIGWTEGSLVIKQVTVKSIDYCVGTSRPDSIAGLEHPLPDMKAPGTYITPWVCVSGDTSLATAECTGDKRWGYEWSDIKATCQGRIVEMTTSTTPETSLSTTGVPFTDETDEPSSDETDEPSTEITEEPVTDVPSTDIPSTDVPATDVPATDVPATYVPATDVPSTDVPSTDVPSTDVPSTDVPPTYVPATDVPATDVPATDVPATYVPATYVPSTDVPSTDVPATDVPATYVPATDVPATDLPSTDVPSTEITEEPVTYVPATDVPSTDVPYTDVPFTDVPSTDVPSTDVPFTDVPSTDVLSTEITEEPVTDVIEAYSTLTKLETTTSQALETTSTKTVAPIKSTSLPFSNSTDSTIDRRQRDVLGTTEKISRLVRTVISAMRLSLSNVTLQFRKQIDDILDPQNKTENRTISESGYLNGTVDDDALELSSNESTTQIVPTALHDGSSSSEGRKPTEEVTDRPPVLKCPARNLSVELTNRTYALPESPVETVWNSTETCARGNGPLVTTKCMEDKTKVVKWAPYQVNPLCNHTSVTRVTSPKTKKLVALSVKTIDKKNVAEVSENLRTLINASEPENFTTTDVALIADTLTKVAQMESEDLPEQTAQAILDSVSDVSQLPGDVLQGAQNESDATNRILRTADKLGSLLQLDSEETSKRLVSGGIGLEVWDIDKQSPGDSSVIGIKVLSEGEEDKIGNDQLQTQFTDSSRSNDNTQTAIYLPEEILQQYTSENQTSKVRLVMNVYKDTNLYDSSASDTMVSVDGAKVNRTLNSRVIAAQLLVNGTQISDLGGSKVVAVFEPIVTDVAKEGWTHKISCAFWNFSSDLSDGHWSTEGCEHNIDENGRVVCECTHLTNFAVLLDYYDQSSMAHKEVLGYITKIGLSLSIIGLTLSMIAFLCIKKLRKGRPQQTMFQLSLSLVLSWLVFLIGIERTSNYGGCLFVAALLHYLILTSFMWMLMEAVVQYLLFVKVMNPHISHYMWKMGLPSWGLPLIPVVIILASDHENYIGGDHYCWMSRHVMYYGFALPVGLVLLSNLGIFILIVVSLFRRKDMSEHSSMKTNQTLVNIRASFISFCMLGLTWLFGFLAIEGARLVFQYLFCITASLQGFFIFLMITARDRQIRRYLLDNVCCCLKKWVRRDSSGVTPTSTLSVGRKRSRPLKARLTELFFGTATGKSNEIMSTTATMLPSESITKADTSSIGDEHTIPSDPTEDVQSKAEATV